MTLPPSLLTSAIRERAVARLDLKLDWSASLDAFCRRVADEIRYVNILFPEYTPHDEQYHLSRLFYVADTLIGQNRYGGFNLAELLVLAAGLYAHDWGMAVSETEKAAILSGSAIGLHDEPARLSEYCA